jgi:hypothetical protein
LPDVPILAVDALFARINCTLLTGPLPEFNWKLLLTAKFAKVGTVETIGLT